MSRETQSLQIADQVTDPGAREAIEQAVAAHRERDKREAAQRAANQGARSADAAALIRPLLAIVRADPDAEQVFARLGAEDGMGGLRSSRRMGSSPAAPTTANLRDDL